MCKNIYPCIVGLLTIEKVDENIFYCNENDQNGTKREAYCGDSLYFLTLLFGTQIIVCGKTGMNYGMIRVILKMYSIEIEYSAQIN